MPPAERTFPDPDSLAMALAAALAERLSAAIESRGRALLAVSGGRSPKAMFAHLARTPLDWSRLTVTLVDERWLPPDHPDSNARLVRENLLVGSAAAAHFAPMWNGAPSPQAGLTACEAMLQALPRPFDATILGMGDDGHTASLFPKAAGLADALDTRREALCAAIDPPDAPHPRMTLTLRAILASRVLILQVSGDDKLAVYQKALDAGGPVEEMPIRAMLRQDVVPIEVWQSIIA